MMAEKEAISPQVTDGITQTNVATLASTPSYALAQSTLAFAQSQGVLFANMISDQQRQSTSSMAAVIKCVENILDIEKKEDGEPRETSSVLRSSYPHQKQTNTLKTETDSNNNDAFYGKLDSLFTGNIDHF